jgi:tyrosine-protein kinase Etk/Wzc
VSNQSPSASGQLNAVTAPHGETEYSTIDLLQYARATWRGRYAILGFSLAGLVLGGIAAYNIRPKYDAVVRFLPPEQKSSLSALSLVSGSGSSTGQGDHYLGLVKSRTVADDVIARQHLVDYFHAKKLSQARIRLDAISKIVTDKNQFITVTVRAAEPETAMNIANEYVDALYRLNHSIALAEAEHRWEYYEAPLEEEKNKLAAAEEDLKRAQQQTGMMFPEAQVHSGIAAVIELRQSIASSEAQLAALQTGTTDQNPDVVRLKSEIASLNAEKARLEQEAGGAQASFTANPRMPELTLEIERKVREVKFHETLFEVLSKQYENARVDESYSPPIEVVDRAVLPDQKSWPPHMILMLLGLLLGGLLGLTRAWLHAAGIPRRIKEFLALATAESKAHGHDN